MGNDNRIRLDLTPVPFPPAVGAPQEQTGCLSDSFPTPNSQARYDQIRSFLLGLLSNQSSPDEPYEKRTGTLWYQRSTTTNANEFINVHRGPESDGTGGTWDSLADHIAITNGDTITTLAEAMATVFATLQYSAPRVIWSGQIAIGNSSNTILIPPDFNGYAAMPNMQALVYINGLLLDPRICVIIPGEAAYIQITDAFILQPNQKFSVILEYVTQLKQDTFIS